MIKIKAFLKTVWGRVTIAAAAVVLLGAALGGGYAYWQYSLPKFQDVTMELGEQMPPIDRFFTEHAKADKAAFVTDEETLDLTAVGELPVTLRHGRKEETVKLVIQDTTAPALELRDVSVSIGQTLCAEDFVVNCFDFSAFTVDFVKPLSTLNEYGSVQVEIAAEDVYGNVTTAVCTLNYVWLRESVTIELGQTLTTEDLLLDAKDSDLLDQADIDALNRSPAGTYTISSTAYGQTLNCTVIIEDTTGPSLKLHPAQIYKGESVTLNSFLDSAEDLSGEPTVELTGVPDVNQAGEQVVVVTATDAFGNTTVEQTTLTVLVDTQGPTFSGVSAMTVQKYADPNYTTGVTAYDNRDGVVSFNYDASGVNTAVAGTYYVTYTAADKAGNRSTYRRKVVVAHDAADTAALVKAAAAKCGNDPMSIKIYVRDLIAYTGYDGGSDPVWHGFTNKTGNCYVHALCLQTVLREKGYNTKLIWVTDRSHYWILVDMGGYWRHIDATPGPSHGDTGLMTDAERLARLGGRVWDTSAWPACE